MRYIKSIKAEFSICLDIFLIYVRYLMAILCKCSAIKWRCPSIADHSFKAADQVIIGVIREVLARVLANKIILYFGKICYRVLS